MIELIAFLLFIIICIMSPPVGIGIFIACIVGFVLTFIFFWLKDNISWL